MSRWPARTTAERFWSKVDKAGDCWLWTASTTSTGYGSFKVDGSSQMSHRYAYESAVGAILDGLVLDHLCRNRACVNPAHLEPVTQAENLRRADGIIAAQVTRTHCPQNHPYAGDNLFYDAGSRRCRTCSRIKQRRRDTARRLDGKQVSA